MKITKILWIIISIIFLFWVYYLFISPIILKPKTIEIPNVEGLKEEDAVRLLKENNLSYEIHYINGVNEEVKYTTPLAGIKVYEGYNIKVFIERKEPSYYPSFEGLLFNENKKLIDDFCKDNNISYEIEYTIDENGIDNQILAQSKDNDDLVLEGDKLLLTINRANAYFSMPNLVGLNVYDALDLLNEYEIEYTIVYYNAPIIEDTILSQEIAPGTVLKKKAKHILHIYVSKGMPETLFSVNIIEICNILNDLSYNYDIIYVDSQIENKLIRIEYDLDNNKYLLYVSK